MCRGEGEAASQGGGVEGAPLDSHCYQPTQIPRMGGAQWRRGEEPPAFSRGPYIAGFPAAVPNDLE